MINFRMEYIDVLFPISLGPLTYRCQGANLESAKPGMIVSAPLKNKTAKGIIIGKSSSVPPVDVKDILKIYNDAPIFGGKMINLLRWMSEYYMTEQGIVLKNMIPKEAFTKVKKKDTKTEQVTGQPINTTAVDNITVTHLINSVNKNAYRTFLLHAPSYEYEYSFLINILSSINNAIVLVPEVSLINSLYFFLNERFGKRVCLFHSGLSRGRRSEAIERIVSGHSDIILGTRSAVFAPVRKVSFIAVLSEHSSSYKQENIPCYSGRDVAVKRGYFEKATVLLSSVCPSVESLYNCKKNKYSLLTPVSDVRKPKIRIIDMRYEKLLKPYLSKKVVDASLKYVKNDKKIMFVINRRGYSTLQCMDCNYIEECPDCKIPLVFHKQDMSLKCHYCGYILSKVPESCSRCRSYNMKLLGAGTQRIQEDIEQLTGIETLRIDSDRSRKKSEVKGLEVAAFSDSSRIIVGTKLMTKRLGISGEFSMAAILNTDLSLNLPDFRSAEKAFQDISSISNKIEPGGEIFVQTKMPHNYLFKYLKNYDYISFFNEELSRRKTLSYPPYSKLLVIKLISKRNVSKELSEVIKKTDKEVEVLGPSVLKGTGDKKEFRVVLRASAQERLHTAAGIFIQLFKGFKDVIIRIDVDPISI
ncbi:MAG: primosomal protein N' [Nitrospirae bacterium RBG_13_39_12]|nr:MAG: primosomal protein N' [Nitrospirae bacterium RBG_13_39_12]